MTTIKPFSVEISQQQIDDLKLRLVLARYPERETVGDWSQGIPLDYLRKLAGYWQHDYDMLRLQKRLNALPQFITEIDGLNIHFIHLRSPHANARPLLLSHGWPGSIVEFLKVIPLLTDPVAHSGDARDAFHIVCPSLPGYGFSGKPTATGWGVPRIARALSELMSRLGYPAYFAQGGDWGSAITTAIAQQDPHCRAIHLNMVAARPTKEQLANPQPPDQAALAALQHYRDWDSGYSTQQGTRPQTIGYSLVDSPVGLLAWIVEKFWAWTDCNGDPENALSKDEMLDNVMVYWLNAAGASSARLYWESFRSFVQGEITTPTGVSAFPKEIIQAPRGWAENIYKNIVYWNDLPRGGHFAAFEQPELFTNEVRNCFRDQTLV